MGGRGGDPIAPSDFSGIEKRTHEESNIFFSISPPKFLNLPPVLFVVVRFLPTTMYCYI